jgi:hypothetical protein
MAKDVSSFERAAAIRVLAQRARRLAQALTVDADRARLLQYAEELEDQADRLESGDGKPQAQVQQQQVQEQQQEAPDTPDSPPDKPKPH